MELWVVLTLALGIVLALVPVELAVGAAVRGKGDGSWAASGAARLFGLVAAVASGSGVPTVVDVRVLGRGIRGGAARSRRTERQGGTSWLSSLSRFQRTWARWKRWIDPVDVAAFVLTERRRLSLRDVEGSVNLALQDVFLAGRIAGALAMLSALLAPFGRLSHAVELGGEDRLEAQLSFAIRFRPGVLAADAIWFFVRSVRLRRPLERRPSHPAQAAAR